jgi:hypothetical protein
MILRIGFESIMGSHAHLSILYNLPTSFSLFLFIKFIISDICMLSSYIYMNLIYTQPLVVF